MLPDEVESRVVELYQKTIGNRKSSGEDGESSTRSEYYPLSPELRELDGINQLVFFDHVFREFRRRVTKHARFQRRIRRSLTELDITFQQTRGTCPFHFLGLTVPDGRDMIVERMRNAGLAPRTLWNPPLVSKYVEESRLGEYPNTKTVVENGVQLPLVEMDEDDVEKAVESIRRALQRRVVGDGSV